MKRKHLITKISTMLILLTLFQSITVFAGPLTFQAQKGSFVHKATAKKAAPNILRFRTIGWTLHYGGKSVRIPATQDSQRNLGNGKVETTFTIPVTKKSGNPNNFYDKMLDPNGPSYIGGPSFKPQLDALFRNGGTIKYDAIITTVSPGSNTPNGSIDSKGNPHGPVAFTYNQAVNLAPWSQATKNAFRDEYYNQNVIIGANADTIVPLPYPVKVYYQDIDTGKDIATTKIIDIYLKNGKSRWINETGPESIRDYKFVKGAVAYKDNPPLNQYANTTNERTINFAITSKSSYHSIVFLYKKGGKPEEPPEEPEDPSGDGNIKFTPVSSSQINGNREGWVKKDIQVRVKYEATEKMIKEGTAPRQYSYVDNWLYRDKGLEQRIKENHTCPYTLSLLFLPSTPSLCPYIIYMLIVHS